MSNSDPTIWVLQHKFRLIRLGNFFFSNLLLSSFGELVQTAASGSCSQLTGKESVWSSAALAHLLQGSTRCLFRNALLHALVVVSGYLRCCSLLISSKQSGHINEAFSARELPLTFFSTLEMIVWENPSRWAVSEMPASLAPTTIFYSKSFKSTFFSVLMLSLKFCKSWPCVHA